MESVCPSLVLHCHSEALAEESRCCGTHTELVLTVLLVTDTTFGFVARVGLRRDCKYPLTPLKKGALWDGLVIIFTDS